MKNTLIHDETKHINCDNVKIEAICDFIKEKCKTHRHTPTYKENCLFVIKFTTTKLKFLCHNYDCNEVKKFISSNCIKDSSFTFRYVCYRVKRLALIPSQNESQNIQNNHRFI